MKDSSMESFLRMALPLYFIIYFGLAFVAKSWIVARRIGKNPLVLPSDDSAYGLIGLYFKLTLIGLFGYVIAFAFWPDWHYFLPIPAWMHTGVRYTGLGFLFVSLGWTLLAQLHMKNSWRIGIDQATKTELITEGVFSISRNPIFLGMLFSLLGLLLVTPNAWTVLFLTVGYMLIQIQIRLEEEFLVTQHGQVYEAYKKRVRRLI